ncbi:hypothetical protein EPUL_002299 [Erysiphe pulchra]|uniref:Reverse transcriptase Ty1/copia-type domain-containing protein n=1 Tax=Erysiphe pulchra TaxID=225359 RepID=A0A2S4PTX4_9PEZI|nr:hypothetical protein EPUL_002299 [Erysiphe pulchra]
MGSVNDPVDGAATAKTVFSAVIVYAQPTVALAASFPNERGLDPEAHCKKCRHRLKNKYCYRLQPELASSKKNKSTNDSKPKLKKSATSIDVDNEFSDSDSSGVMIAASSRFNESLTIYDTTVGSSSLDSTGTSLLTIGNLRLKLHDAIYPPSSTCNIVSAGRLGRISNIVPNYDEMILIKRNSHKHNTGAKLIQKNDAYYVAPITSSTSKTQIVEAPGVARLPITISAQRWHERLGHTGQTILKRTAQTSKGLEGIELSDLITYETCHLSKVQRFVSREPRPTPNQPLDEIHINTVGKVPAALNGHQYVVVITDAMTRMRWCITTGTKDQITPQLIQLVKTQEHQYGKWAYCDQHGIRTDLSAPYTPEQNGIAESANKVVLIKARSMLIDARMPAIYWPWAVEYAGFITNRLYNLRTKKTRLIDFMQGLNQPHTGQVDLSHVPRFGCRADKYIDPKPGEFNPDTANDLSDTESFFSETEEEGESSLPLTRSDENESKEVEPSSSSASLPDQNKHEIEVDDKIMTGWDPVPPVAGQKRALKGYTQRKGIDYQETFAPTPRVETGRILLVLAHQFGWHKRQGDVPTAFLNPDLNIDLYMDIPQGFEKEGYVVKLYKRLYGLIQAAALWCDDVRATLAEHALHPTTSDICLYTNSEKDLVQNCKPTASPIEKLLEPNNAESIPDQKDEHYKIIGGLQYLASNTRPDISFAVNHLARFLQNPLEPDRRIKFLRKNGKTMLKAYADADFSADPSISRSTSGTVIMLGSGPISWRSRLQREVVLSTTEVE